MCYTHKKFKVNTNQIHHIQSRSLTKSIQWYKHRAKKKSKNFKKGFFQADE